MGLSHCFEGEKQVYVYVSVKYCGSLPAENHSSGKVMHSIFIQLGSRKPEHHFPYSDFVENPEERRFYLHEQSRVSRAVDAINCQF